MKALELTKDDRRRLIEMCNVFFPEYKWYFDYDYCKEINLNCKSFGFLYAFKVDKKEEPNNLYNKADITIYWLDLCLQYLVYEIPSRNGKDDWDEMFYNFCTSDTPIAYLYKQYIKYYV